MDCLMGTGQLRKKAIGHLECQIGQKSHILDFKISPTQRHIITILSLYLPLSSTCDSLLSPPSLICTFVHLGRGK